MHTSQNEKANKTSEHARYKAGYPVVNLESIEQSIVTATSEIDTLSLICRGFVFSNTCSSE